MQRIASLDVLRGLAIMIMIFVDTPPGVAYPIFIHAPWEGLTLADFAFPGFVFAMGMSAAVSMSKREPSTKKILTRTILLFAVGILFNLKFAFFEWLILPDFTSENFWLAIENLRVFGILQRLALTYALGIFIARIIRSDLGILIAAFGLLIVSSAGFHIYAPDNPFAEAHNISRAVDYICLGANHIYEPTHDPEGLYGTLASAAQFLFGFFASKVLLDNASIRDKIFIICAGGVIFLIAGGLWSSIDIIAKKIWTAPFALITSAVEMFLLAVLYLLDKIPRAKNFLRPLSSIGMNPLFFFLLANIIVTILYIIPAEGMSIYVWLFQSTLAHVISPEFGSMIFCGLWCLVWLPLAEIMRKRGVVIKL